MHNKHMNMFSSYSLLLLIMTSQCQFT